MQQRTERRNGTNNAAAAAGRRGSVRRSRGNVRATDGRDDATPDVGPIGRSMQVQRRSKHRDAMQKEPTIIYLTVVMILKYRKGNRPAYMTCVRQHLMHSCGHKAGSQTQQPKILETTCGVSTFKSMVNSNCSNLPHLTHDSAPRQFARS